MKKLTHQRQDNADQKRPRRKPSTIEIDAGKLADALLAKEPALRPPHLPSLPWPS